MKVRPRRLGRDRWPTVRRSVTAFWRRGSVTGLLGLGARVRFFRGRCMGIPGLATRSAERGSSRASRSALVATPSSCFVLLGPKRPALRQGCTTPHFFGGVDVAYSPAPPRPSSPRGMAARAALPVSAPAFASLGALVEVRDGIRCGHRSSGVGDWSEGTGFGCSSVPRGGSERRKAEGRCGLGNCSAFGWGGRGVVLVQAAE